MAIEIGEFSLKMSFTWQGSDHLQEILISSVVIYDTIFSLKKSTERKYLSQI